MFLTKKKSKNVIIYEMEETSGEVLLDRVEKVPEARRSMRRQL